MRGEKWIFYDNQQRPAQWWTKKKLQSTSQAKLAPKKGHGYCFTVFCQCDPLQLSQPQGNHYICWEACSADWWDALQTAVPAAGGTGHQKGPDSPPWRCPTTRRTTNAAKTAQIGLWSSASSATFTRPLANQLPLLQAYQQLFVGKILLQPAGGKICFPRVCQILKHRFFSFFIMKWKWSCSVVSDSATPWTVAYHVPLPMGFSRQEYWSGLPFPSPRDLSDPGSLYLITMTILTPILIHNLPFVKFIFNWKIIALQYCVGFCQTSTRVSHRCTYGPSLLSPPPACLPPHPPSLKSLNHTTNYTIAVNTLISCWQTCVDYNSYYID